MFFEKASLWSRLQSPVTGTESVKVINDSAKKLSGCFEWRREVPPMLTLTKVKVGVLRPVQQPGSYWDRSSELPLLGLEPTEVTAYD